MPSRNSIHVSGGRVSTTSKHIRVSRVTSCSFCRIVDSFHPDPSKSAHTCIDMMFVPLFKPSTTFHTAFPTSYPVLMGEIGFNGSVGCLKRPLDELPNVGGGLGIIGVLGGMGLASGVK